MELLTGGPVSKKVMRLDAQLEKISGPHDENAVWERERQDLVVV